MKQIWLLLAFLNCVLAFGRHCKHSIQRGSKRWFANKISPELPPPLLKVAFLGDQGLGKKPIQVLKMIKKWGAQGLIHLGDFDYKDSPSKWLELFTEAKFPHDLPIFGVVGNHDIIQWKEYEKALWSRLEKSGASQGCVGQLGVNMVCQWKGLTLVLSGVGTMGSLHADFIDDTLYSSNLMKQSQGAFPIWNMCMWHKNQRMLQTGDKQDETGYQVYDACRHHGGFIVTAHQHLYCRTKMMTRFDNQTLEIVKRDEDAWLYAMKRKRRKGRKDPHHGPVMNLGPGHSFAVVSGLGGESIRPSESELTHKPWWDVSAAMQDKVQFGALLCTFHVQGDPYLAHCQFQDVKGHIWDDFYIRAATAEQFAGHSTFKKASSKFPPTTRFEEYPLLDPSDIGVPWSIKESSFHMPSLILFDSMETNSVVSDSATLVSDPATLYTFRFRQVRIKPNERLVSATLQVMGAHPSSFMLQSKHYSTWNETTLDMVIKSRIEYSQETSASCLGGLCHWFKKQPKPIKQSMSLIHWDSFDEWEPGEVWVSPDVSSILYGLDYIDSNQPVDIIIEIQGYAHHPLYPTKKGFYGFNGQGLGSCLSPTLALTFNRIN